MVRIECDEKALPLLTTAIEREKKLLDLSIEKTEKRLQEFEKAFGLSTAEMHAKLLRDEIEETLDIIEWIGESKTLEHLREQRQRLEGIKICK